jgi:hypothetical protein
MPKDHSTHPWRPWTEADVRHLRALYADTPTPHNPFPVGARNVCPRSN